VLQGLLLLGYKPVMRRHQPVLSLLLLLLLLLLLPQSVLGVSAGIISGTRGNWLAPPELLLLPLLLLFC
jgi:hypothetical protein